jgi:hypothetical protein
MLWSRGDIVQVVFSFVDRRLEVKAGAGRQQPNLSFGTAARCDYSRHIKPNPQI